ncbi:hypothetical protein Ppb6_02740 [Photorhabdus australis subsp. thailandensis]|uniref:Uncharacterized protein n=1 Tax=Photorhabdus australis subsp. thailandensis TaxID=2805096 RepID=A0A1C0U2D1_9GAMM|nr:hypothetical protein Ppb6_02740 [Photorhabdus australis subsp. thailandensis]
MKKMKSGGRWAYVVLFVVWLNCANISHNELKIVRREEMCIFCRYIYIESSIGSLSG